MNELKPQVYVDDREASRFDHFHERIRSAPPNPAVYNFVRTITGVPSWTVFRSRAIGLENIPTTGAVIVAPNHFSHWDHFLVGVHVPRQIQFMAKSQLFGNRVLDFLFKYGGTFPVQRGKGDHEALTTSRAVLDRDGLLLMYPEGGRSRTGTISEEAKGGVGRLALESGAKVVPTAIVGSDKIRRIRQDLPRLKFPKVTVQFGEPIDFGRLASPSRDQAQQVADEVLSKVRSMYDSLSRALEEVPRRKVMRAARRGVLPEALVPAELGPGASAS